MELNYRSLRREPRLCLPLAPFLVPLVWLRGMRGRGHASLRNLLGWFPSLPRLPSPFIILKRLETGRLRRMPVSPPAKTVFANPDEREQIHGLAGTKTRPESVFLA